MLHSCGCRKQWSLFNRHDCCIVRLHWSIVTVSVCTVFKICQLFLKKEGGCFSQDLQQSAAANRGSVCLYLHSILKSTVQSHKGAGIFIKHWMKDEKRLFFPAGIHCMGNNLDYSHLMKSECSQTTRESSGRESIRSHHIVTVKLLTTTVDGDSYICTQCYLKKMTFV